MNFATRGNNTLDFVYTTVKNAYKAEPRPHLGYSDHISVMLTPAYRPLLKLAKPVQKQITVWPDNATSDLCGIQVSGPAQATCSNTLSSTCTRHFHTPLCVHNPTKHWLKYMTVMYVCLLAHAPQITLHCSPASCLNVSLLHMYSIWSHLHSCTVCILLYFILFFSLCIGNHFYI